MIYLSVPNTQVYRKLPAFGLRVPSAFFWVGSATLNGDLKKKVPAAWQHDAGFDGMRRRQQHPTPGGRVEWTLWSLPMEASGLKTSVLCRPLSQEKRIEGIVRPKAVMMYWTSGEKCTSQNS